MKASHIRNRLTGTECHQAISQFFQANPDLAGLPFQSPLDQEMALNRILARASESNHALLYSLTLQIYLINKGLTPPKGVFNIEMVHPDNKGRPRKIAEQIRVWACYHRMKNPTFGKVARDVFPNEYGQNQKAAADRTRQLYRSFEKLLPKLPGAELAIVPR